MTADDPPDALARVLAAVRSIPGPRAPADDDCDCQPCIARRYLETNAAAKLDLDHQARLTAEQIRREQR